MLYENILIIYLSFFSIISESSSQYTEQKDPQLSSWEKWLIQKSKSERKKQREIRRAKKQEKTIKEKEKQDKEMKEKKAEERRKEWLEQKSYEEKLRKKNDRQRKRLEKDLKEDEKRRIAVKAEGNYDEWMERKKKEEKDLKKEQKRRQQEVEHAKKKQQIDAQHKYEEWLHRSKNRPKSVPNSFGYTSGKLTGMLNQWWGLEGLLPRMIFLSSGYEKVVFEGCFFFKENKITVRKLSVNKKSVFSLTCYASVESQRQRCIITSNMTKTN